jgi:hypothetical protein
MAVLSSLLVAACGDYSGGSGGAVGVEIEPLPVPDGLPLDEQVDIFGSTVYPVLRNYCAGGCHDSGQRGSPFLFASSDVDYAYNEISRSGKVDLDDPPASRIVERPALESHNCRPNCDRIGAEMLDAVERWAAIFDSYIPPP